jgi:hypothetical protein
LQKGGKKKEEKKGHQKTRRRSEEKLEDVHFLTSLNKKNLLDKKFKKENNPMKKIRKRKPNEDNCIEAASFSSPLLSTSFSPLFFLSSFSL